MSDHWENVIWESKDGSWNRGYFERINAESTKESPEEGAEPSDEFDFSTFASVKTGFATEALAYAWMPFGNPRGAITYHYKGNSTICKDLDRMAFYFGNPESRARRERSVHNRLRREHFRALENQWAELGGLEGKRVTVVICDDDRVYDFGGESYSGYVKRRGDWLTVENKRVFNTRTGHFHWRISSVMEAPIKRGARRDNVHSIGVNVGKMSSSRVTQNIEEAAKALTH